jgi:signal transduction histidine kinase
MVMARCTAPSRNVDEFGHAWRGITEQDIVLFQSSTFRSPTASEATLRDSRKRLPYQRSLLKFVQTSIPRAKPKLKNFCGLPKIFQEVFGVALTRFLFLLMVFCLEKADAAPRSARQGVVDLQNLVPDQPLHLGGEWMFFWNEALEPQDFLKRLNEQGPAPKIIEIGQSFSEIVGETIRNDQGYGTYVVRFTSIDPETMQNLWLAGGQIYTAARGYFFSATGEGMTRPVFSAGTFGTTADTTHPRLTDSHASHLSIHGKQDHYLLIQVANFHSYWGGIWVPPYIGHEALVWKEMRASRRSGNFLTGALIFICVYSLTLFVLRRSDRASLALGVFTGLITLRTVGFRLLNREFGDGDFISFEFAYKLIYFTMPLGPSVLLLFIRYLYPNQIRHRLPWILLMLGSPHYLLVLFSPVSVYSAYLDILKYVSMSLVVVGCYHLWKAYRAREVGSNISLLGGSAFGISCLMDVLWTNGWTWLPTNSLSFGLLFFIMAQSQILALQFSRAFRRAKYLTVSLRDEVEQQTRDTACILDSIQQGVFTVDDENLAIGAVRSPYLNQILPHARDSQTLDDLLMQPMQITNDRKSQVTSTIQSAIGSDLFNFEVNAGCLVKEAEFKPASGECRYLQLDWTPMVDDQDQVDKILVCVRDVTEEKQLQAQTRHNREQLQMIEELANIAEDRFRRFALRTHAFIQQNITLIRENPRAFDRNVVDQLFINMHSIKGSARTYMLASIAALSHDMEQGYAALIKNERNWNADELIAELRNLADLLQRYETLGKEKLHWSLGDKVLKLPKAYLEGCLDKADRLLLVERSVSRKAEGGLVNLVQGFAALAATPLAAVIDDASKGLDSLARDLKKEMPRIELSNNDVFIRNAGDELLHEVLVHLLRNSIDHGIETPSERIAAGKEPHGLVQIAVSTNDQDLIIELRDDGRGLNLELIRQKAIQHRLIKEEDQLSVEQTAALIFHSGLSTKQEVSQVSGRGVGMDAVRSYLQKNGGDIHLLLVPQVEKSPLISFSFQLIIPSRFWCSSRSIEIPTYRKAV